MRVGKRPAVPAFSLIITENSDKEVEWQNKQNVQYNAQKKIA
jgi:hypothetical protein